LAASEAAVLDITVGPQVPTSTVSPPPSSPPPAPPDETPPNETPPNETLPPETPVDPGTGGGP
jgi:hypothetical protein